MIPELFEVTRTQREATDTFTMWLKPLSGPALKFLPGQFNMLYTFGVGEVPISISGDPAKPEELVHTIRVVGAVTEALGKLTAGATVGVRGPFGTAWPVEEGKGKDVVFVAGGIGLAPLRPALYHIAANRQNYGKVVLFYGARTPNDLLYEDEVDYLDKEANIKALVTVDQADRAWRGNVGVVTTLIPKGDFDPKNAVAMVCGPEIMMRYCVSTLKQKGMEDSAIYLSMERNMKCGIGLCGHCQFMPEFMCKDGPVFSYDKIREFVFVKEV